MGTRDVVMAHRGPTIAPSLQVLPRGGGPIELAPTPEHRLWIHTGAPVRGTCNVAGRFVSTRGDIDLFPAHRSAAWREEDATTSLEILLPEALLRFTAGDLGLDPDRMEIAPRYRFRDERIEHIAWALDAERRAGGPAGFLYVESLGVALAAHLLRGYGAELRVQPRVRSGLSKPQLDRILEYVDAHLGQSLSLVKLARVAGVSASHLKAQFKRSTGLTVHAYVIRRRVERARMLIVRGGMSLSEAALEAGFAHQSHMARCMRRILGVTPAAFARGDRAVTAPRFDASET
jgi:AraC family transcriptional regulator